MAAAALVAVAFYFAIVVLMIASMWRVFTKAGQPGWAALIPIYNTIVLLEIVGKPVWWILLLLIPVVNLVFVVILFVELAKCFGKGAGFAVGLILLGFVFFPMLAFGDAEYLGPDGGGAPRRRKVRRDRDGYEDDYDDDDFDDRPRKKISARGGRDDDFDDDDDRDERPRKRLPPPDDDFDDEAPRSARIKAAAPKPPPLPIPAPKAPAAGDSSVVECSSCGRKLKIPATAVGKKVKCPSCGNAFVA